MRLAVALLVALAPAPSFGQEEVADAMRLAIADGFEPLTEWHRGDGGEFGASLDRLVVAPFMRVHAPQAGYAFRFRQIDLDGDGDGDVVVDLRTDASLTSGDGGPVLVARFEGGRWSQPELYEAMHVVQRDPGDRAGWEVAVVQADGYVLVGE